MPTRRCARHPVGLITGPYHSPPAVWLEEPLGNRAGPSARASHPALAAARQGSQNRLVGKWHLCALPNYSRSEAHDSSGANASGRRFHPKVGGNEDGWDGDFGPTRVGYYLICGRPQLRSSSASRATSVLPHRPHRTALAVGSHNAPAAPNPPISTTELRRARSSLRRGTLQTTPTCTRSMQHRPGPHRLIQGTRIRTPSRFHQRQRRRAVSDTWPSRERRPSCSKAAPGTFHRHVACLTAPGARDSCLRGLLPTFWLRGVAPPPDFPTTARHPPALSAVR